jgi:hypothetical protein
MGASRRKRKRERLRESSAGEAAAPNEPRAAPTPPPSGNRCGGWGRSAEFARGDLVTIRKAIREGWPVSRKVRRQIVHLLVQQGLDGSPRMSVAAVRTLLAADRANLNALKRIYTI